MHSAVHAFAAAAAAAVKNWTGAPSKLLGFSAAPSGQRSI